MKDESVGAGWLHFGVKIDESPFFDGYIAVASRPVDHTALVDIHSTKPCDKLGLSVQYRCTRLW